MKYCTNCGKQIPDESIVCEHCQASQVQSAPLQAATKSPKHPITKKLIIILAIILFIIVLIFMMDIICINHDWKAATCIEPAQCWKCDKYKDDELGNHDWQEATCTMPRTCFLCHLEDGEPLGHNWKSATCLEAQTCLRCSEIVGEAGSHSWIEATCTTPKTCTICNTVEGTPTEHLPEEWVVISEATETSTGTRTRACINCNEVIESETTYYYDITEQEQELYTNALDTYYSLQSIHLNPESFKWLGVVVNDQTQRTTIYISYVGGDNTTHTDYFWKDLNDAIISNKYGEHNYQSDVLSLSQLNIDEMLYFESFCGYMKTLVSSDNIDVSY